MVGLLGSKGQGDGQRPGLLALPLATMQRRVVGHTRINTILVSMKRGAATPTVLRASLEQLMRERPPGSPTPTAP